MAELEERLEDERLLELFTTLREHVVQLVTDLSERVQAGILAEDDGRFGPPSLRDILADLTGNASGVITDLAGLGPDEPEDPE